MVHPAWCFFGLRACPRQLVRHLDVLHNGESQVPPARSVLRGAGLGHGRDPENAVWTPEVMVP
jgi:hypothetical protein